MVAARLDPGRAAAALVPVPPPADLPGDEVLVVGAGNSAAQLAVELSATRRVIVAAPGGMWLLPARILGVSLYWWLVLTGVLNGRSSSPTSRLVRRRGDGTSAASCRRSSQPAGCACSSSASWASRAGRCDSRTQDPATPTSKQLRDARRQAHEAQKASAGEDRGKKGKKGKGDPKP